MHPARPIVAYRQSSKKTEINVSPTCHITVSPPPPPPPPPPPVVDSPYPFPPPLLDSVFPLQPPFPYGYPYAYNQPPFLCNNNTFNPAFLNYYQPGCNGYANALPLPPSPPPCFYNDPQPYCGPPPPPSYCCPPPLPPPPPPCYNNDPPPYCPVNNPYF